MVLLFICKKHLVLTIELDILLAKLKHGIRSIANIWFKYYFFRKKQFVSIRGYVSNEASVNYSVPQGSVLGPFSFLPSRQLHVQKLTIEVLEQGVKYVRS